MLVALDPRPRIEPVSSLVSARDGAVALDYGQVTLILARMTVLADSPARPPDRRQTAR
jgi:hypothetical protein